MSEVPGPSLEEMGLEPEQNQSFSDRLAKSKTARLVLPALAMLSFISNPRISEAGEENAAREYLRVEKGTAMHVKAALTEYTRPDLKEDLGDGRFRINFEPTVNYVTWAGESEKIQKKLTTEDYDPKIEAQKEIGKTIEDAEEKFKDKKGILSVIGGYVREQYNQLFSKNVIGEKTVTEASLGDVNADIAEDLTKAYFELKKAGASQEDITAAMQVIEKTEIDTTNDRASKEMMGSSDQVK